MKQKNEFGQISKRKINFNKRLKSAEKKLLGFCIDV